MRFPLPTPSRRPLAAVVMAGVLLGACGSGADEGSTASADGDTALNITIDEATTDTEATSDAPESLDADTTAPVDADDQPESTDDEPAAEPLLLGGRLAPEGQRSLWTGTIDGRIGITMWLTQYEGLVRGELTYDTVGQPIAVHGEAYPSGDAWYLQEIGDDGRVSGTLILGAVVDGEVAQASWGELDLELTLDGIDETPTFFDPLVRPGRYEYSFGPFPGEDPCCGPTGSLEISAVTTDTVTIEIENVTGGPGYNLAIIDPIVVPLDGNVARYELTDDLVDCAFEIEIFDGYAHVRHLDERYECLFGNAAGVEGIYVLTEQFVTAEQSSFAGDAVLTSDGFGGVTLGMTWAELTTDFGAPAYDPATADEISEGCNYVQISGDPWSPWFMLLGDGEQSVVSRIELVRDDQLTADGIGLGSTIDDIRAAYGEVTTSPHVYLGEGAEYVTVVDATDPDSTILFETDTTGVVIAVRNGYLDPIRWIEGCA